MTPRPRAGRRDWLGGAPEVDPVGATAGELRRRVGGAFRAEREVAELEADQLARRRSTIVDVARSIAHRGDRVEVDVNGRAFLGEVVGAGPDHLWLHGEPGSIHIAVAAVRVMRTLGTRGDGRPAEDPGSLRAFLRTCEMDGRRVTVLGDGLEVEGVIRTCASDHVVVHDDAGDLLVPIAQVAAIIDRSDAPTRMG